MSSVTKPILLDETGRRMADALENIETGLAKPNKIINGTWWVWDAANMVYVDTGVSATGPTGSTGNTGAKGDAGAVFIPAVSAAGILSWGNNGGLPNPASVNIPALVRGSMDVTVTGTDPVISGQANYYYKCGEVHTIGITAPASGHFIVVFSSGTTAAVMSATGITWPEWFDPTALEAEYTYEISVMDGRGAVMAWPI